MRSIAAQRSGDDEPSTTACARAISYQGASSWSPLSAPRCATTLWLHTDTLPLETARTLASGGDVKLNCLDRGFGRVEGAGMKITAVNVSSVSVP